MSGVSQMFISHIRKDSLSERRSSEINVTDEQPFIKMTTSNERQTNMISFGPMADGWTDRNESNLGETTSSTTMNNKVSFLRLVSPSDESIEIANIFTMY